MKLSKAVIFLLLGLFFKVAVAGNSTQVYLLDLEFESSAKNNFTEFLKDLTSINTNKSIVTNINNTTECTLNEMQKECSCLPGYTWSEKIRKNNNCSNIICQLQVNETAVCLYEKKVSINGSSVVSNEICNDLCYGNKQSPQYINKTIEYTAQLAGNYSTLNYFDFLIITGYRSGSVIADYTVQFLGPISLAELEQVVVQVPNSTLTTAGLISINASQDQPVDIGSSLSITCTLPQDLGPVKWFLNSQNKTTEITNGQEAELTKGSLLDTVHLNSISGSWKGIFTCMYTKGSIRHTASTELDIALLPEIQAMSAPQFPDCRGDQKAPKTIEIVCQITSNSENYSVEWNAPLLSDLSMKPTEIQGKMIKYKAAGTILCAYKYETVYAECQFTNNRAKSNKIKSQKVDIPIIYDNSKICKEEGYWPITKSNYSASRYCENNAAGLISRKCFNEVWQQEISTCVNIDLVDIKNEVEDLNKGIGFINTNADNIFKRIKDSTTVTTFSSFPNINTSVNIFEVMNNVSLRQVNKWNDSIMPNLFSALSNLLNDTNAWRNPETGATNYSLNYLLMIETTMKMSELAKNDPYKFPNLKLTPCDSTTSTNCSNFNASISSNSQPVIAVGFRNLHEILPKYKGNNLETTILSVIPANNSNTTDQKTTLMFDYSEQRLPNHEMICIFWDEHKAEWSTEGCKWGGADNPKACICDHNSAFTILMSKSPETLPYLEEITYVGLGISVISLVLCLIIEILVWDAVVKSDISNFRHVALFNICLCLLLAHCGFLASSKPEEILSQWCLILTVVRHFFFLAVFSWMLCLSFVLLHQMIFVFDHLRKKVFLILSITVGYVFPVIGVAVTFITFENGKADQYYSTKTCWLVYKGVLKGSIFAFVIPVAAIVMINLFTLAVVIIKIVTPTVSESKAREEKGIARSMIKTIVFLSPVLGITWILGVFVLSLDLTKKPWAQIVNYTFTILNSLQGFFILMTNCIGEKKVRDALLKRFKGKQSGHYKTESSTKSSSSVVKK